MALLNFNASTVSPDTGGADPVPAGWYNVIMDESEIKPTKDGSGAFLACRFSILDGQYVGRKLFTNLNIRNANPTAQEIAYKQLSAIAHSVGVLQVEDSQQLHNIPLKVKASLKAAHDGYEASNEIKGYRNINENVGQAPAASQTPPPAFQQPAQPAFTTPVQQPVQQPPQQFAPQPWQQPVQQPASQVPLQPVQQPAVQQQPAWAAQPQQQPQPEQQPPATQQQGAANPPWMQ